MVFKSSLALLAVFATPTSAGLLRIPLQTVSTLHRQLHLGGESQLYAANLGDIEHDVAVNHTKPVVQYYGEISVGTPGQALPVLFSTRSADLWVSTNGAKEGESYNPDLSTTSVKSDQALQIKTTKGATEVSGDLCTDTVSIGGLTMPKFQFLQVRNASGINIKHWESMPFTGVLGLGLGSTAGGVPTVMETLVRSKQLDEPVFGFNLRHEPAELVLGGVDPAHITGNFTFVDVIPGSLQWAVPLDSVQFGPRVYNSSNTTIAIVDIDIDFHGVELLLGPPEEVYAIAAQVGASNASGKYEVSCEQTMPSVVFTFGGRDFALESGDLVHKVPGENVCIFGIRPLPNVMPVWYLPGAFKRKYYVQFDSGNRRVGFALASNGSRRMSHNLV